MAEWNPQHYMQFKKDRLRPAIELLARVDLENPNFVVDLGCGPGTSTKILGERYPDAKIVGVDNSASMLEKAQDYYSGARYVCRDVWQWKPESPVDLIYSNAAFHWLPDHEKLLSKLAKTLKPGGVLAFQMPDNLDEFSHLAIADLVEMDRWKGALAGANQDRSALANANQYYDWMIGDFDHIDIWRTCYAHIMPSHEHIVAWMKGAALTPYLDLLSVPDQQELLADYLKKVSNVYPLQADGSVIFHFPRLFVVARKTG